MPETQVSFVNEAPELYVLRHCFGVSGNVFIHLQTME
jgi:hypothetical protein